MIKTYCIVANPPTSEQIAAAIESPDTVRKSVDGTECVLKWKGPTPAPFQGKTTYTHVQILPIMHSVEWTVPMPHDDGDD